MAVNKELDHDEQHNLQGDLESPFLQEAFLDGESEAEWEGRLEALEGESPFLNAFEQGREKPVAESFLHNTQDGSQERLEDLPAEGAEEFFAVEETPSLKPLPFPQNCQLRLQATRVAVVGGGLGGLMAALRLSQHGVKVTVYEARPYAGGRVLSNHKFSNGRIIEFGAELIGSFHNEWLGLAHRYGLGLISRMDTELYHLAGLNVKLRLDKDLTMDEIKAVDDEMATRVLEPIAKEAGTIKDATKPWDEPRLKHFDNMSVADALEKIYRVKRNERLWMYLQLKLVNDEVASLEDMNFLGLLCKVKGGQDKRFGTDDSILMGYWDELEIFRSADGCQRLAVEMSKEIGSKAGCKVVKKIAVTDIKLNKRGVKLTSKNVTWPGGKLGSVVESDSPYDYVILAIPPNVWDDVTITDEGKRADPKLEIGKLGTGPAVKFFSEVKKRFWIHRKAAPSGGTLKLGQIWEGTDNQTQTGDQGIVLSVFAGPILSGPKGPRPPTQNEMMDQLRDLYPDYLKNPKTAYVNWPEERFIMTGYWTPKKGEIFKVGKKLNEPFHGRLFFAGEHTQMDYFGYMEGALRSGRRAAAQLMKLACGLLKEPQSQVLVA